jgi:hypothetical protein
MSNQINQTMKKYEGKSIRKVKTATGPVPVGVGFPSNMSGVINKKGIGPDIFPAILDSDFGREHIIVARVKVA